MKKNKLKRLSMLAVAGVMSMGTVFGLAACTPKDEETPAPVTYSVEFDQQLKDTSKSWELTKTNGVEYYIVKNVTYCSTPTHAKIQSMNIYVPKNYLNSDGTVNTAGEQGNYTAETAPIIYLNNVSGYSGGTPWEINSSFRRAGDKYGYGWYYNYLERGFVLVFVGERGIGETIKDENGVSHLIGVSPISLVDLKAGIRFLRHNTDLIPGDTERIISSGVSAGGNCSALLGASGNTTLFDTYLEEIGAVMTEKDDVYASQDYCPITDLDHASLAYEWFWQGDACINPNSNQPAFDITGFKGAISEQMAIQYAKYFNSLNLTDENGGSLTMPLDGSRTGTMADWMVKQYEAAYNTYVAASSDTDSSIYNWLSYDATSGANISCPDTGDYTDVFNAMQALGSRYNTRQKVVMSFDTPELNGDNGVFGKYLTAKSSSDVNRHFTPLMCDALEAVKADYPTEYSNYYQAYYDDTHNQEVLNQINWYSPFYYINNKDDLNVTPSEHFRICVGTQDEDTSPTISATLALFLMNNGYDAVYEMMWNQVHEDADRENAFEDWVDALFAAVEEN